MLRALVVDDDEKHRSTIMESFDLEFGNYGLDVEWTHSSGVTEARRKIRDMTPKKGPFHFAVVDLQFDEEQQGISVVEELRSDDRRTFILLVTSFPGKYPNFWDKARAAGANEAAVRRELLDNSSTRGFKKLAGRIRADLLNSQLIGEGVLSIDPEDPGAVSIVESVGGGAGLDEHARGRQIIGNLAMNCIEGHTEPQPDPGKIVLRYLVPGKSGASICRLDQQREGQPAESFVLKFGLDQEALERERLANREAAHVLDEQTLVAINNSIHTDSSGYSAFVSRLADKAVTLAEWLTNDATPEQARSISHELFGERLRPLFQPELRRDVQLHLWLATPTLTRLRLRFLLDRYRQVIQSPSVQYDGNVDDLILTILNFVDNCDMPVENANRLSGDVTYVKGFGDLHSSNVLVRLGSFPRPVLVDASGYGDHHWARDSSRLLVDIFLRLRGSLVQSFFWDDFAESSAAALTGLCSICRRGDHLLSPDVVQVFVDGFLTSFTDFLQLEMLRVPQSSSHWQWHLSLAKEFLRQACHSDLTPPRSALALVSGDGHLREASRLIDGVEF